MSNIFTAIKADSDNNLIAQILSWPLEHEGWTLQGFGMLRLYLTKELRLHVWDARYRVSNVSLIHTHPWDFESYIVWGRLKNIRYEVVEGDGHLFSTIKCGVGACIKTSPQPCGLVEVKNEFLEAGKVYSQKAHEIHKSVPENGTVTLIERTFKADTEHANIFWPKGTDWVSGEPRRATKKEIENICEYAVNTWTI